MKGVLAKWYKTGNCAVEAVDLGRREKNETLGWGRQMGSLFSAASLSLFCSLPPFPLSLSTSRALPFESPRHRRISTCQRSYSPLDRASSRAFVAPPSFILASSSERSEAETRRVLLSRTASLVSTSAVPSFSSFAFLFYPSLLPRERRAYHLFPRFRPWRPSPFLSFLSR